MGIYIRDMIERTLRDMGFDYITQKGDMVFAYEGKEDGTCVVAVFTMVDGAELVEVGGHEIEVRGRVYVPPARQEKDGVGGHGECEWCTGDYMCLGCTDILNMSVNERLEVV